MYSCGRNGVGYWSISINSYKVLFVSLQPLLDQLQSHPSSVEFADVIAAIDAHYDYQDCEFSNGNTLNAAGTNVGSCKIFAFAQLHDLSEAQTLACFGQYYRNDVLANPDGDDHQNIRNFMNSGWAGIAFNGTALSAK